MRKFRIAFAVLAVAALAGCQENEIVDTGYTPEKGEIVFRVKGNSKMTKSSDNDVTVKGMTIPLGTFGQENFFLEETITDLDCVSYGPETKGTPGYTENFNSLYGGFNATVYRTGETSVYEEDGRFVVANAEGLIYKRKYPNDLWDKQGLYFFLSAYYNNGSLAGVSDLQGHPVAEAAVTSGENQHPAYAAGDISFHYTSANLATATSQSDLLFTSREVSTQEEYEKLIDQNSGVPVLFHHALSGVKFRVGNDNSGTTKTIITKVELIGLYDTGDCIITPEKENGGYTDIAGTHSSASAVKWSNRSYNGQSTPSSATKFYQQFEGTNYSAGYSANVKDNTVDYVSGNNNTFGDSWYQNNGANDPNPSNLNNLNDSDGSMTFWFIPQAFKNTDGTTRDVTLKLTFYVTTPDTPSGREIPYTISNFGETLGNADVEWKAGQLRTYTLAPRDVDVDIFDEVTATKKSNLHITNTGNVDEYVRVLIMGNWYGWKSEDSKNDGDPASILVGYKYQTESDVPEGHSFGEMVLPWFRGGYPCKNGEYYISEDEAKSHGWVAADGYADPYGYFDPSFTLGDLTGKYNSSDRDGQYQDWADASGGFYYTAKLGPGEEIESGTQNLFQSYTVSSVPTIYLPSGDSRVEAYGVHLEMEVVVQAIAVPTVTDKSSSNYGKDVWWLEAWYRATDVSKLNPVDKKNNKYRNIKYLRLFNSGEYEDQVYDEVVVPTDLPTE